MNSKGNKGFLIKKRLQSFIYAFNGVMHMIRTQHNSRIHIGAGVLAVVLGLLLKISITEWIFIAIAIGIVIMAELFNTAFEQLVDLISPEISDKAGNIKDVSAAAVLVASITALIIGLIIFLPKIF